MESLTEEASTPESAEPRGARPPRRRAAKPPPLELTTGRSWPMGSSVDETGVNFAVFSAHAEQVDLCVYDTTGERLLGRVELPGRSGDVWHGHLAGVGAGLVYGYRAHGRWAPDEGHRFNAAKLLLDPYAREIVGRFDWTDPRFVPDANQPDRFDRRDNGELALKARVTADASYPRAAWQRPKALADTVLYEVHVKGFSRLNPQVPAALRGTYAGLGHPASTGHLRRLGVTAVSLLPVHHRIDEQRLVGMGLTNYWGYNTIGFFALEPRLAAARDGAGQRAEFRQMVQALHLAGIEVILDVVYNHTAEAGEGGPKISFRGLDNASYYRLAEQRRYYENWTGCGNTIDIRQPRVLQLVLDSLRYWVETMGVDGFRFDLASVLGRESPGFFKRAAFFQAIAQDPVLARAKMIAEPWDLGPGGYQVGGYPNGWGEWNDKFRDDVRAFWLGHPSSRGAFARRLCGSSDAFHHGGRAPSDSIDYVISHDGFTLTDLVSYRDRHNEANGEENRDGTGNNLSNNCGVEGPTDDPAVLERRHRLKRALLASVLLAQGTPMIAAGDELGHTQGGNNNPYCQDSPVTWIDWSTADDDLIAYTARLIALRRRARPFRARWYRGLTDPLGLHDLIWLNADGVPLDGGAWDDGHDRFFGCLIGKPGRAAAPLLLLVNACEQDRDFRLPAGVWELLLDTRRARGDAFWQGQGESDLRVPAGAMLLLAAAGAGVNLDPDGP